MPSDICYLEFYYEGENIRECPYCEEEGDVTCEKCKNINGLIKINNECGCQCDENRGFKKEPQGNRCVCKDGYFLSGDASKCEPLKINHEYCLEEDESDEKSLNYIYYDLSNGRSICFENDLPMCCKNEAYNPGECRRKVWFELGEHIFYSSRRGKCVFITFNNKIVMYSKKSDCEYNKTEEYKNCLGVDITNEEQFYNAINNAYEYKEDDNNSSLNISIINPTEKTKITFYLLNNYTEKNSSVTLSKRCIDKIKEEKKVQNLLIFIATIKKEGYISTQVEYSFYNSTPENIDQILDVKNICSKPNNSDNNFNKRKLEVSQEWKNNGNCTADIDEICVNVEIDWTSVYKDNIKNLEEKGINIFDSDDPFYNDVCFKYTVEKNKTDIYLQERRDYYFIKDGLCESGCKQVGFDNVTYRILCKCKIKGNTEGYENITFVPNKGFEEDYLGPNIKVLKCFNKLQFCLAFLISFILLIWFIVISFLNYNICFCCWKREENRRYFHWEIPIEELKDKLQKDEDEFKKDPNINYDNGGGGNQGDVDQDDDPDVKSFRKPLEKKKKRVINNDPKKNSDKVNLPLIDPSETSSQKIVNKTYTKDTEVSGIISEKQSNNNKKISDINLINVTKKEKKEEKEKEKEEEEEKEEENEEENEEEKIKKEEEKKELEKFAELYSDKQSVTSLKSDGSKTLPSKDHSYSKDSKNISFSQKSDKEINNKKEPKPNPPMRGLGYDRPSKDISSRRINRENTRVQINNNRRCVLTNYYDLIYTAVKYPESIASIFFRWFAKMVSENTALFSLVCSKYDKNDFFIKHSVLIISISFYISINIVFQINTSTLHLFLTPDEKFGAYIPGWFYNILPNIFAYLLIHFFKDSLSLREFYLEEYERIDHISHNLIIRKYQFHEWEIKKKYEITRIKKFRNNLANNIRLTIIFGLIILSIDLYYITVFFSVYENSFWCVVVNILMSILIHIGFFAIVHLISSFCNFNLARYLFKLSECCCVYFYCIFLSWKFCNEEFQKNEEKDEIANEIANEIAEEEHKIIRNQNNNVSQESRSRNSNIPTDNQVVTNQIYTYQNFNN